jgi:hypothetical protein
VHGDYRASMATIDVSDDPLLVFFIAPPWGEALDKENGLDLRQTTPPIGDILRLLCDRFPRSPAVFAIQVYERVNADSVADLQAFFAWRGLHIYGLNAAGQNHGILLGTRGFTPRADPFAPHDS